MKEGHQPVADSGSSNPEKNGTEAHRIGDSREDSCRCKEVSEKTFSGMFRLMLSDLTFWKKNKGGR